MSELTVTTDAPIDPEAFADALLDTGDLRSAAKACGIMIPHAQSIGRSVTIVRSMRDKAKARIGTDLLAKAIRTLERCMDPSMPPAVQLKASLSIAAMAGLAAPDDDTRERGLDDLSADELNAFIRRADCELGRRPGAARPIGGGSAG